ncbi:hypothetical protein NPX13_g10384 [Xylaria arbuscula]|uniref:Uncharacterized protein n=1 Tax=Xylaria arbuscula TaxID=114810 RepID=A0A9W8THJ5_9PEZI|nr:hypothetical protein NPX13_g10384 [Xylaria arbuscula]
MAVEQGTDGRIRAETKYYTSLCQTFIHNKQKALEELSVSLDHLTRCADSLNAMLSQGTTGEMRLHASQASQATTDVLKDVEVQIASGAIIRITIEKSPASGLNPGEDENAQQVGNQDRGKSAEKSRAQSPSVCTVKSAESVTNNNTARSTKRSSEATTPIQEAELRLSKKPRQAGDRPTILHHLLEKSESLGPETHAHHSKALDPLNKNLNEPTRPSNGQSTEPAQRPPQSRQPRASEMPKEGDDMLRQPPIALALHRKLTLGSFGDPANPPAHERARDSNAHASLNDTVLKTNNQLSTGQ